MLTFAHIKSATHRNMNAPQTENKIENYIKTQACNLAQNARNQRLDFFSSIFSLTVRRNSSAL